jgi:phosphate-selective porin OprO/OprP
MPGPPLRALACVAALAFASVAGAGEAPETPDVRAWATSWSWKQGLYYGIDRPGFHDLWESGDLRWKPLIRGSIGFRLAVDAAGLRQGGGWVDLDQNVEVRRGYFYADGAVSDLGKPVTFKLEVGAVDDRFSLRNASISIHDIPYAGTFTMGAFDAPMSLSMLSSSRSTPLMERGTPVEALAPGTKAGFQFANWIEPYRFTWAFGFFSEGNDADVGDASQAAARFMGRVTWLPWRASDRDFVHVGLSGSWAFSPGAKLHYRSRPESFLAPYVVDTGDIDAQQATISGLETVWQRDRLSVQAESLIARVFRDTAADPVFGGVYVMASWFLTPDARKYEEPKAAFVSIDPSRPLSWKARQLGAFEVALRTSYLDLSDADVHGGRVSELMSGLNWYWNHYVRVQFNVGWAHVIGGPRPGDYGVFQTRLDLMI